MPKHNNTSFKKGHKRSAESIAKQVATMKKQIANGERKVPKTIWTKSLKLKMVSSIRKTLLVKNPIGSRRKHKSREGLIYWVIKTSDRGRWRYEHRVLIEAHIGRKLTTEEHIHHINGDTLDNRIDNLTIMTMQEHMAEHRKLRK